MNRRINVVKTANEINAIEGAPVSRYARELSTSLVKGELTGMQMKQTLLAEHMKIAEQEQNNRA